MQQHEDRCNQAGLHPGAPPLSGEKQCLPAAAPPPRFPAGAEAPHPTASTPWYLFSLGQGPSPKQEQLTLRQSQLLILFLFPLPSSFPSIWPNP